MKIEELSSELVEQARACKTPEEILALAKEAGLELTDAELEAVTGGVALTAGTSQFNRRLFGWESYEEIAENGKPKPTNPENEFVSPSVLG